MTAVGKFYHQRTNDNYLFFTIGEILDEKGYSTDRMLAFLANKYDKKFQFIETYRMAIFTSSFIKIKDDELKNEFAHAILKKLFSNEKLIKEISRYKLQRFN